MVRCVRVEGEESMADSRMKVISVSKSREHNFSKEAQSEIELVRGMGVDGDSHSGRTVQHRSRVAVDPDQPNLRQVHLIHEELFIELKEDGFDIRPGEIGENITTRGIDLLSLPVGTILKLGEKARVEITGLRNPCTQLDVFRKGLMSAVLEKKPDGSVIRKSGVMGIVLEGGKVRPGDLIQIVYPPEPYEPLGAV